MNAIDSVDRMTSALLSGAPGRQQQHPAASLQACAHLRKPGGPVPPIHDGKQRQRHGDHSQRHRDKDGSDIKGHDGCPKRASKSSCSLSADWRSGNVAEVLLQVQQCCSFGWRQVANAFE
jgi:hypothetical protein